MISHLLSAIIFVSITGVFCALVWLGFAYIRHVHRVLLMMADSGYGYRDSAYLVRRVTRRWLGRPPGTHRSAGPEKQQPLTLVAIEGDPTTVPEQPWPMNGHGPATVPVTLSPPAETITMEASRGR